MSDKGSENGSDQEADANKGVGDNGSSTKTGDNRPLLIATIFAILLLVVSFATYSYLGRDMRPDVWEEPTTSYEDAACEDSQCETVTIGAAGHGTHDSEETAALVYDPAIDDEIAQWGDCRAEIQICIQNAMTDASNPDTDEARVSIISTCVAAADTCPTECKTHFAENTVSANFQNTEQQYFSIFEDKGGYCVPREADE